LDVGERRIGVAVSDPTETLARPLTTITRSSRRADFEALDQLMKEHSVARIIVGLPLSLDGTEGQQARQTQRYAKRLSLALGVTVEFWDERYSTATAIEFLRRKKGGRRQRQRRDEIDAMAAAVILQSYIDAQGS